MKCFIKKHKLDNLIKKIIKMFLHIFHVFQINTNSVFFISYGGQQYSCNPKYISEYMNKNNEHSYEIIWTFKDVKKFDWLKKYNYRIVKYGSLKYIKAILTSKVIVTNISLSGYLPIRRGQTVINTWHGGGAYKMAIADVNNKSKESMKVYTDIVNIFLSTCKKSSDLVIRKTFGYNGKILEVGYPRNDIFFEDTTNVKRKVFQYFDLNLKDKIVLYAPTFRGNTDEKTYNIDIQEVKLALEKRFGGNWIVMIRAHHYIRENFDFEKYKDVIIDATEYSDMQELLCSADLLITDYSSCIWDFSLMYKPSILYVTDLDSYIKERNFYVPIEEWHFSIAKSNKELSEIIKNFDIYENKKNIEKHLKEFGSFETGKASAIVVNEINKVLSE